VLLQAESRVPDGFDRGVRPAHLDLRRVLAAEQVEQQLARRSGDARGRFPPPGPDGASGPGPLKLDTRTAQPPREVPGSAADVVPQRLVHALLAGPGITAVGSADVLMVDVELVEAREPTHPSDAEETSRRPGPERGDKPGEVPARERSLPPFGEAAPRAGQDEPWAGQTVALAQDEMRGDIAGRPRREQSRRVRTELVQQVTEPCPLGGVEVRTGHTAGV